MKKLILLCLVGLSLIAWGIFGKNDYTKEKDVKCLVLDKIQTGADYKISAHFYLIVKEERGYVFELDVYPSVFSQAKMGEYIIFTISESTIRDRGSANSLFVLHFFSIIIGSFILIVCIINKLIEY